MSEPKSDDNYVEEFVRKFPDILSPNAQRISNARKRDIITTLRTTLAAVRKSEGERCANEVYKDMVTIDERLNELKARDDDGDQYRRYGLVEAYAILKHTLLGLSSPKTHDSK